MSKHQTKRSDSAESRWWRKQEADEPPDPTSRRGQACPKCLLGDLDYDTLFRLRCPVCHFVADCGAFT